MTVVPVLRTGSLLLLALVVAACGTSSAPSAQCAAPGLRVDVRSLPLEWVAKGAFQLCQGGVCAVQRSPFTPHYGNGPFIARRQADTAAVAVSVRVRLGGREVLSAQTLGAVRPSTVERGEISEVCGGNVTLRLTRAGVLLDAEPRHT